MIVLTTPTGQIGRLTLARLLDADAPVRVIARDPDRLPAGVRDRVEVVAGSHGDAEVVAKAFAGADTLFWLPPPNPTAPTLDAAFVDFSRAAAVALRDAAIERVVAVSALGRGTSLAHHAGHVTASLAMDDLLAATGVAYRALTMPSFMDNLLRQTEPLGAQGTFFTPNDGTHAAPTCAVTDIAEVAARLLLDTTWTGVDEVPVLGPEDLSYDDMARIMSEVLDRPIRHTSLPPAQFKSFMTATGMSDAMAQGLVDMARAKDSGLDNATPRTAGTASPTTFRQWCEDVLRPALKA